MLNDNEFRKYHHEEPDAVHVGLIAGRHPLPVSEYIFSSGIQNVFDFEFLSKKISEFIEAKIEIGWCYESALNGCNYYDIKSFVSDRSLVVYTTGLTCVTAELIRICACNGVKLTLMHYNNATGEYVPQKLF